MLRAPFAFALAFSAFLAGQPSLHAQTCDCDVTPAACDSGCACDEECAFDWTAEAKKSESLEAVADVDERVLELIENGDGTEGPSTNLTALDLEIDPSYQARKGGTALRDESLDDATSQAATDPRIGGGCTSTLVQPARTSSFGSLLPLALAGALLLLRTRRLRSAGLLLAALGLLAGCGGAPSDPTSSEEDAVRALAAAPCTLGADPPLVLLYASVGWKDLSLLAGCPGEVVVGEKGENGPRSAMTHPAAHSSGGRTGFVLGANGRKIRDLLRQNNGVARTEHYLRQKLASGYDYIVIDEITSDPDWADGALINRRFRQLLQRMPPRTIIGYISLDLTMRPGGDGYMRDRRFLLRALKTRGRALALEVYLHTDEVMAGAAPGAFATAVDRVLHAVRGLRYAGGIQSRMITTLGLSMHTRYPEYNYLDDPRHDLTAISREVNAILHGPSRLRAQNGIGYYFVDLGDLMPRRGAPYTIDTLIDRLHISAERFKSPR